MSERIMKNFPIEYEGQTYWRSRSCAVAGFIFCKNQEGKWCVLANQRGPGAPNYVGKWNCPCGYVGFVESEGDIDGEHAIARETFEETGIKLLPYDFIFDSVSFSSEYDENITLRYVNILSNTIENYIITNEFNEPNETDDIGWIPIYDIDNYDWAFDHDKIISLYYNKYITSHF